MGELIHEPSNKTQKPARLSYTSFVTVQTKSGGNNGLYAELRKFRTLTVVRHSVSTFNLTHPEIAQHLGITQQGAYYHVNQLVKKGWLVKDPRAHRGLYVA
jgi:hypothetical protein